MNDLSFDLYLFSPTRLYEVGTPSTELLLNRLWLPLNADTTAVLLTIEHSWLHLWWLQVVATVELLVSRSM